MGMRTRHEAAGPPPAFDQAGLRELRHDPCSRSSANSRTESSARVRKEADDRVAIPPDRMRASISDRMRWCSETAAALTDVTGVTSFRFRGSAACIPPPLRVPSHRFPCNRCGRFGYDRPKAASRRPDRDRFRGIGRAAGGAACRTPPEACPASRICPSSRKAICSPTEAAKPISCDTTTMVMPSAASARMTFNTSPGEFGGRATMWVRRTA